MMNDAYDEWNEVNREVDQWIGEDTPYRTKPLPTHNGWHGRAVYDQDEEYQPLPKQFLLWEHELQQPNYYDYFLEEVTRNAARNRT